LALQNGNQKRQPEAATRSGKRSGKRNGNTSGKGQKIGE